MNNSLPSVALIRGKFTNRFELQNYEPLAHKMNAKVISSKFPIDDTSGTLQTEKLYSPADLPCADTIIKYLCNRTIGDMHVLASLEKVVKQYEILHTADPFYYYSYQSALLRAHNPQKRLIVTCWETKAFANEKTAAKRKIKEFVQTHVDIFLTYTRRAADTLILEGINPKKIVTIPLGIDTKRFVKKTSQLHQILFVGRLVPEKNPELVLNVFSKIHEVHPEYTLKFIGKGPLEKALKSKINSLGLGRFVAVTSENYTNMHMAYQQSEICILPSISTPTWEEQYGMVLLEAMSSSLAIVATQCGAIPEVLGTAGILVGQRNERETYTAMLHTIEDKPYRTKLGTMARERAVKYFNRDQFAQKMYETYLSCHSDT